MNSDLAKAKEILKSGTYTCVLCRNDIVYSCTQRGVKPLLDWIDSEAEFKDFSAADKVVGKAAAFLYIILGVKAVYADVMSKGAIGVLKKQGIEIHYDKSVEYIINRAGNGKCPMESAVWDITVPSEAESAIRTRLEELKSAT